MCDIIIRGQSVCIRDHFCVFLPVFLFSVPLSGRFGHKERSREDGVARSDVPLTSFYSKRSLKLISPSTTTTTTTMSLSTHTSSSSSLQLSNLAQQTDSHSCDTLPPARPSSPSFTVSDDQDQWSSPPSPPYPSLDLPSTILSQPTPRKLCIRHQRIADEGTNLKLQQVRVFPLLSLAKSLPPLYLITSHARHLNMPNICKFSLLPS